MIYQTSITKKGQITIPKKLREYLGVKRNIKLTLEPEQGKRIVKIKPAPDILELAGAFKPLKKPIDPVRARELMEKTYERF